MSQADIRRNKGDRGVGVAVLLALALGATPARAQEQQPAVGEQVEALNRYAGEKLSILRAALQGADPLAHAALVQVLQPRIAFPSGPPDRVLLYEGPYLGVRRFERGATDGRTHAGTALELALTEWLPCSERRIELKVVGIEPREAGFDATVLVHALGARGLALHQLNARWVLQWRSDGQGQPALIAGIAIPFEERVDAQRPLFSEASAGVLDPASGRTNLLSWGCDTWVDRIDHVGEPHWFGHNGIALGDVDGDGLEDLYVATGTGTPNLLLVRRPDGTLEECGHEAGVAWLDDTKGVLLLDFDNDGDKDLLLAMGPTLVLCKNDGQGVFTPNNSLQAATNSAFYSLAAADFDLDGDLDVYALRYVQSAYGESIPTPFQDARNGPRNHLLRNDGEAFTDVTDAVGLGANNDRFSLAASWADFDDDGDADLYVANDFGRNNLYRNEGGSFVDVAAELGVEDQAAGMGVAWGDFDRDGDLDLHVANMFSSAGLRVAYQPDFRAGQDDAVVAGARRHALGNSLFVNDDGQLRDISDAAGIRMGRWAWGARFADLDGDGYEDLVVPNGFMTGTSTDDL